MKFLLRIGMLLSIVVMSIFVVNFTNIVHAAYEEVIPLSNARNQRDTERIKAYNDRFNQMKNDLEANGLADSPYGRQLLRRYRTSFPRHIRGAIEHPNDHRYTDYSYLSGVEQMNLHARPRVFGEIRAMAERNNVDPSIISGYGLDNGHVKTISTVNNEEFDANGKVNNNPSGGGAGTGSGTGSNNNPSGGGAGTGSNSSTSQTGGQNTNSGNSQPSGYNTNSSSGSGVSSSGNSGGIVPCGGVNANDQSQACTICHLIEGIHNIVKFIMGLIVVTATVVIVVAGVMYIVSAGNPAMITMAKTAIKNALIGVVVILTAFMMITFIANRMFGATGHGLGSRVWHFECQ